MKTSSYVKRVCWMRAILLAVAIFSLAPATEALAKPRRPNPQQVKRAREQMQYQQSEMMRVQKETAAIHQKIFTQFDENGNGKLDGAEKGKYNKYMTAVEKGKEPNPFAEVAPLGKGPKPTGK